MTNKKLGSDFEQEFADLLFNKGFWVHRIVGSDSGQPADIIAVRDGIPLLIDCKVCTDDTFKLSRIEENQKHAMNLWQSCGNMPALFAFKFRDGSIYLLSKQVLDEHDSKTINKETIIKKGVMVL